MDPRNFWKGLKNIISPQNPTQHRFTDTGDKNGRILTKENEIEEHQSKKERNRNRACEK